jgi:hypothetical protein
MNTQVSAIGADTRQLSARKTFWIMLMIIQALSQFILHYWTVDYGANASVVSHLGFAGTLVSIALAIVAIVYAYFQNYAQKRDADSVATQIAQMRELLSSLNASGNQISNHAALLQEMHGHIAQMNSVQEEVRATTSRIERSMDAKREADSTAQESSSDPNATARIPERIESQLMRVGPLLLFCFYAMDQVQKRNGTIQLYRKVLNVASTARIQSKATHKENIDLLANWIEGIGSGAFYLLAGLNLVGFDEAEKKDGGAETIRLKSSFEARIPEALEILSNIEPAKLANLLLSKEAIDEAVEKVLPRERNA